jgi:hypothetical protein
LAAARAAAASLFRLSAMSRSYGRQPGMGLADLGISLLVLAVVFWAYFTTGA